ncbi:hypothetical protein K2173_020879 [Erythroxylum novogranatense]|uniref:Ribosomal protein n=1 Tax=Erythroxylum novogranatense TaxID=1862640 RepID=A0AAV8TPV8_9ROSI|nr:hypothetical protein K2173_020879 [Erythroxylum novogranatense]
MKVRSSVVEMCEFCEIVKRHGRVYVGSYLHRQMLSRRFYPSQCWGRSGFAHTQKADQQHYLVGVREIGNCIYPVRSRN